jgi:hypothetical protein
VGTWWHGVVAGTAAGGIFRGTGIVMGVDVPLAGCRACRITFSLAGTTHPPR